MAELLYVSQVYAKLVFCQVITGLRDRFKKRVVDSSAAKDEMKPDARPVNTLMPGLGIRVQVWSSQSLSPSKETTRLGRDRLKKLQSMPRHIALAQAAPWSSKETDKMEISRMMLRKRSPPP